jgi:hypothetical protein
MRELRLRKFTYQQIASVTRFSQQTVWLAMKRFSSRGSHVDLRAANGHKNPNRKITARMTQYLLRPDTMQQWSGLTLQ